MRSLMKEKEGALPQIHPLICIEGVIKAKALEEKDCTGMNQDQINKMQIETVVKFSTKLLARLPANSRFDAVRHELNTLLSFVDTSASSSVGEVMERLYKAMLYLVKETRGKELENMSFVLSAEEPFEMLMKHLLEHMPLKMDLERR